MLADASVIDAVVSIGRRAIIDFVRAVQKSRPAKLGEVSSLRVRHDRKKTERALGI